MEPLKRLLGDLQMMTNNREANEFSQATSTA
jgi:hypothetical protein